MFNNFMLMGGGRDGYRYVGSASGAAGSTVLDIKNVTLAPHIDTLPDDLLVAFVAGYCSGAGGVPGLPTGWTARASPATGVYVARNCIRTREAGDGSYTFGITSCYSMGLIILTFRNSPIGNFGQITSSADGSVNVAQVSGTIAGSDLIGFGATMSNSAVNPTINSFPGTMEELGRVLSPAVAQGRTLVWAGVEKNLAGGNTGTRPFDFSHVSRSCMIEVRK